MVQIHLFLALPLSDFRESVSSWEVIALELATGT